MDNPETRIEAALNDFTANRFSSLSRAAEAYSVNPRTLQRRFKGGKTRSQGKEEQRCLSTREEEELVDWLLELTECNIPARVGMINGMAATILRARPLPVSRTSVGPRWYQGFIKRHPTLTTKFSRAIDHSRAVAFTKTVAQDWFSTYEKVCEKYAITLERTYNMDETGIAMGVLGRSLVVVPRKEADKYMKQPGNRNWVSILETIGGTGKTIEPFLVFKGVKHQLNWYPRSMPTTWRFALSENGWTNNELGLTWLQDHFDPLTRPSDSRQYRLLLLDGHSSHTTYEFLHYCRSNRIVVLCLPAHTTHKLQPLDVGCFQPLKAYYQRALEMDSRRGITAIEKYRFIELYAQVRPQAFDERHINQAWRETGLIPFDPSTFYCRTFGETNTNGTALTTTRPVTPNPTSSSPLPPQTKSSAIRTPSNLQELAHYDRKYQELSLFSSIDASPSARRYEKILHAAETALISGSIFKERYNELRQLNGIGSTGPRKRRQINTSGKVLTAEVLDQIEQERWEEGDATSSESDEEDLWSHQLQTLVLPDETHPIDIANVMEERGIDGSCTSFKRGTRPFVDPGTTGRRRSQGRGSRTTQRREVGSSRRGVTARGRGAGSTNRGGRARGRGAGLL